MHVHDIHMHGHECEEYVKMANLHQKKYVMWVVTAQESVKSQQYEHCCEVFLVNNDTNSPHIEVGQSPHRNWSNEEWAMLTSKHPIEFVVKCGQY